MSTKSTILHIDSTDEHIYYDWIERAYGDNGEYIGEKIYMELSKENVSVSFDDGNVTLEFNNINSEIYNTFKCLAAYDEITSKQNSLVVTLGRANIGSNKYWGIGEGFIFIELCDPRSSSYGLIKSLQE